MTTPIHDLILNHPRLPDDYREQADWLAYAAEGMTSSAPVENVSLTTRVIIALLSQLIGDDPLKLALLSELLDGDQP